MKKIIIPALFLMGSCTTMPLWSAKELLGFLQPKADVAVQAEVVAADPMVEVVAQEVSGEAQVAASGSWKKYIPGCPAVVSQAGVKVSNLVKTYPKTSIVAAVVAVMLTVKLLEVWEESEEELF